MTSPVDQFAFSTDQINVADTYRSRGDLSGMYRYLSQQVEAGGGDPRLSNWLATAADINGNEGFYAAFVRGATYSAGKKAGVDITPDVFQRASDMLAENVFRTLTTEGSISLVDCND